MWGIPHSRSSCSDEADAMAASAADAFPRAEFSESGTIGDITFALEVRQLVALALPAFELAWAAPPPATFMCHRDCHALTSPDIKTNWPGLSRRVASAQVQVRYHRVVHCICARSHRRLRITGSAFSPSWKCEPRKHKLCRGFHVKLSGYLCWKRACWLCALTAVIRHACGTMLLIKDARSISSRVRAAPRNFRAQELQLYHSFPQVSAVIGLRILSTQNSRCIRVPTAKRT